MNEIRALNTRTLLFCLADLLAFNYPCPKPGGGGGGDSASGAMLEDKSTEGTSTDKEK